MAAKDPSASEAVWQSIVEQIAVTNGWQVFHPKRHQVRAGVYRTDGAGFPDLVLAHPAKGVIFAELKTEIGRLSVSQIVWANALKPHVEHYVWRPSQIDLVAARLSRQSA
jgi:hypothetical protein